MDNEEKNGSHVTFIFFNKSVILVCLGGQIKMKMRIINVNVMRWIILRFAVAMFTVFVGLTILFIATRTCPKDPASEIVGRLTAMGGALGGEELAILRNQILQIFGLDKPLWMQYLLFLKNVLTWNFGPSYIYFPTPVSDIINNSIWWTVFLLLTVIVISWLLGVILGALASYFEEKRISQALNWLCTVIYPLPYVVFALVLFLIFSIIFRVYTGVGGAGGMKPSLSLDFILAALSRAWLPALSLILLWIAGWFLSTYLLTAGVKREDYLYYATIRGLSQKDILSRYLLKNVMLPQITGLALSLGNVFSGAVATEYIFSYPGLGFLLMIGLMRADYNLILGISAYSIMGIAFAAFLLDLIYPIIDPRIRYGYRGE